MNNKGVVLIMVLWVLMVLSLIAWGLGRRSSLEVSLLETYRGKLRSYAAARAGINMIMDMLQKTPSTKDTLYSSGINIDVTKSPESLFAHMDVGNKEFASVAWNAQNYNTNSQPQLEYGLSDEEGRININAINISNYQILSALLQLKGVSAGDADQLALAIVDYTGTNAQVSSNNSFLQLDDSSMKTKNRPYDNILELLEVNGMTHDIFDKIKDDVTVYGNSQNGLWINTDTASNDVIQAVVNAAVRLNPAINPSDILREAYAVRDGADGVSFSPDDGVTSLASSTDPNWPSSLHDGLSGYYRARVVGVDSDSGTKTILEAVIQYAQGTPGKIIAWQRE